MTISVANASADQTLDQASDTLVDSMTLTPGEAGVAVFTGYVDAVASTADQRYEFSIYVNNAIVQHTERALAVEDSEAGAGVMFLVTTHAFVSPTAGQAVEVRYRRTAGTVNAVMKRRTLTFFPAAAADVQQVTATANATVSATSDTLLTGMTITPGVGPWLLLFSDSAQNVAAGISLFHSVYVNNVKLAHTEREGWAEASIAANLGSKPCLIACKVAPTAGQAVEIRCRRVTNNWTVFERTLTLVKVADADIKEASGTVDDTGTETSYTLVSDMTITDPGVADWLALFSTSQRYGTITANQRTDYSIFNAGAQDTNTERLQSQESSIDNADYYGFTHGKITVAGATDDVDVRQKGLNAVSHTIKERTFVLVREAAAGAPAAIPMRSLMGVGT